MYIIKWKGDSAGELRMVSLDECLESPVQQRLSTQVKLSYL